VSGNSGIRTFAQMTKSTTLVLLPGLDGTEVFFQPLLDSLPASVRPVVVSYPPSGGSGYAELLAVVRRAVAAGPECYVLGWSFSGPLALMLAAAEPSKVRGVILSATFVRPPRQLLLRLKFALIGPVVWIWRAARRLPLWVFRSHSDPFRRAKSQTWTRVSAGVVAARLRAILAVDAREPLCGCPQPVLYIAASRDNIVPSHNVSEITRVRPSVKVVTIAGPHLAMYTNPQSAAQAIVRFIAEVSDYPRPA
jgi:pimeloyl-ACP methyl ester carboxylesterase